jgi:hypothetical protein
MAGAFDDACALAERALDGAFRRDVVAEAARGADAAGALRRLRDSMRTHAWKAGGLRLDLAAPVEALDRASRDVGFHILHDWDGKADHLNPNTIAVDVLNFIIEQRGTGPANETVLAVLVDYYFAYLLMLLATDAVVARSDAGLDRVTHLVGQLQASQGSGQLFAADAETLFLIGTSHFELKDAAYDTLLERSRALSYAHRLRLALSHSASLGSHLRFGYEVTYIKSYQLMRDDNGVDYRWLCFALSVLLEEYERTRKPDASAVDRERLVEVILNGLSSDPGAFVGGAPHVSMAPCHDEWSALRDRLQQYRADLLEEFKPHRPLDRAYSPLALFFNFSHNVLKGTIADALLWGEAWHVSFSDLLTGTQPGDPKGAAREKLARALMGYARASPDSIGGRLAPVIVYDPASARRAYARVIEVFKEPAP